MIAVYKNLNSNGKASFAIIDEDEEKILGLIYVPQDIDIFNRDKNCRFCKECNNSFGIKNLSSGYFQFCPGEENCKKIWKLWKYWEDKK